MANQLGKIEHIVELMLENRSFDHMLGFLYADSGNRSPGTADALRPQRPLRRRRNLPLQQRKAD